MFLKDQCVLGQTSFMVSYFKTNFIISGKYTDFKF